MKITTQFDSGRIEVVQASNPSDIQLKIDHDSHSDFRQWFHFRLSGAAEVACRIRLLNASECSFPDWKSYQVVASYDREEWFRVPTTFDGQQLIVEHTPVFNDVYYAYFAPYSFERHLSLLAQSQQSPYCTVERLGETVDGRDFDCLVVGEPGPNKKTVWVIARQHPGESMAEWCAEGLIDRLLQDDDALARQLRHNTVFYIVPNMNPDGSVRGNLRTNAAGANLNREWLEPSRTKSPEVFYVREKMYQTGVDLFLDLHGDEQLPYVFLAGCEGVPNYTPAQELLAKQFADVLKAVNPDFQTQFGYGTDGPGEADLSLATNYVGNAFGCVAYTLEMPFKDNANAPDEVYGWSPERSLLLGASLLNPIAEVLAG